MIKIDRSKVESAVWALIKTERDNRKDCGFECGGYRWHSDPESKAQYIGNKDLARDQLEAGGGMNDPLLDPTTETPIMWKTMSGEFVPMTCQLAFDVAAAAKSYEFRLFDAAEAHKAAMIASDNPAGYDFSAGWPSDSE